MVPRTIFFSGRPDTLSFMLVPFVASLVALFASAATPVYALGSTCSRPLGAGTAAPGEPFWLQNMKHQGISAFNSDPSTYQVFRNVKDFGAKGDGVHDDTDAIKYVRRLLLSDNMFMCVALRFHPAHDVEMPLARRRRMTTPALVFFPSGTYLISGALNIYYYTELTGDARNPPTILATPSFNGFAIFDVDPYIPGGGGAEWYTNQNNFFRSARNFILDLRQVPPTTVAYGIHWQVAQATSLQNIVIEMSTAPDAQQDGVWIENGSGGFIGDLVINGGKITVRNVTINNAQTGILMNWNWGWTFQNLNINNATVVAFDVLTGGLTTATQTAGSESIIDATITDSPIFLRTSTASNGTLGGSVVLNNVKLKNVPTAVGVVGGAVVLAGGTKTIASWAQGNVYTGKNGERKFVQGAIEAPPKPSSLLDSSGKIFGRGRPQYESYATSQFVSARSLGAKGDGKTDDTAALQSILDKYSGCKIIFLDAGTYVVTSTLEIPAGTHIVGEAWSVIAGKGFRFENIDAPIPVVRVGLPGSSGVVEISDILFSVIGPTPGAIVVEWNVRQSSQGSAGMWDSHIRLGGSAGSNLLESNCPTSGAGGTKNCMAAYAALHLTAFSSAYLEGTWVWLADHDMESQNQTKISLFSGRGILSESQGPTWFIGTASEHHVLYQYNLVNAANHYMGFMQTETPYYQPIPAPPAPFTVNWAFQDPSDWNGIKAAWGLRVTNSRDILIFGAGFYSFYSNYGEDCLNATPLNCQAQIVDIDSWSSVHMYNLNTVGTTYQLSLNQKGVINEELNPNGLAETVTFWSQS
ncbi:hypothetical protein HMN09_00449200 [Mycena chlorophos]|uniref:Rhamnogalacturonase A/B/Epimerase-like pectate lyase domain-containing protein n=1 Tax=Mycena chlorophos TaxID=658473 RepID=A0A8H6TGK9_MYCCL|nr:hypothetical protein HMN09_00449200 [Mycena chlorophos]